MELIPKKSIIRDLLNRLRGTKNPDKPDKPKTSPNNSVIKYKQEKDR